MPCVLFTCDDNSSTCSRFVPVCFTVPYISAEAPAESTWECHPASAKESCVCRGAAAAAAEVTAAMAAVAAVPGRYAFRDGAVYTGGFARNLQNGHGQALPLG